MGRRRWVYSKRVIDRGATCLLLLLVSAEQHVGEAEGSGDQRAASESEEHGVLGRVAGQTAVRGLVALLHQPKHEQQEQQA